VSDSARSDFAPRYYTVEQALRARIAQLRPNDLLPSETELAREFRVSRMTARAAVMRLVAAGLVYRESGRGTFVAAPPGPRRADLLMRFSEELRRQGKVPTSRVITAGLRRARSAEIDRLRLKRNASVVAITRVRLGDGKPIALEHCVFPSALRTLLDRDLVTGSLHEGLAEAGYQPTSGQAFLSAGNASAREADLLGLSPGQALLVEQRLILDQHGDPLEATESKYVGDRYALGVTFAVQQAAAVPVPAGRGRT
jgi:GntR family transcriptional regulator